MYSVDNIFTSVNLENTVHGKDQTFFSQNVYIIIKRNKTKPTSYDKIHKVYASFKIS